MHEEPFLLTKEMARNYDALCNYLNDNSLKKKNKTTGKGQGKTNKANAKLNTLRSQNFRCVDCGMKFIMDEVGNYPTATYDHIIPYRFGSVLRYNSELVCQPCNNKRHSSEYATITRVFGNITGFDPIPNIPWVDCGRLNGLDHFKKKYGRLAIIKAP